MIMMQIFYDVCPVVVVDTTITLKNHVVNIFVETGATTFRDLGPAEGEPLKV